MLFPKMVWEIKGTGKTVYLTFDDGPIPEVTEWVLAELKKYNAKATFFCIGDNIRKNPSVFKQLAADGHSVGNHTFNHLNGWKTTLSEYLNNVELCEKQLQEHFAINLTKKLFRPPYGKIALAQARHLRKRGFKIIMWDIIAFDFDREVSKEKCLDNVIQNIKPGSIVVFHDSIKASENMKYALPRTLRFLNDNGYKCAAI